jgi:tetratricopeptide (TPR) repeat protein
MKGQVLLAQGRMDEALIEFEQETHEFFNPYGMNFILYAMGKELESEVAFKEYVKKFGKTDPSCTADLYAFRGDYETSFTYLNNALEVKDPTLLEALTYPSFKPMHKDPRWKELINKINLPKNHGFLD